MAPANPKKWPCLRCSCPRVVITKPSMACRPRWKHTRNVFSEPPMPASHLDPLLGCLLEDDIASKYTSTHRPSGFFGGKQKILNHKAEKLLIRNTAKNNSACHAATAIFSKHVIEQGQKPLNGLVISLDAPNWDCFFPMSLVGPWRDRPID